MTTSKSGRTYLGRSFIPLMFTMLIVFSLLLLLSLKKFELLRSIKLLFVFSRLSLLLGLLCSSSFSSPLQNSLKLKILDFFKLLLLMLVLISFLCFYPRSSSFIMSSFKSCRDSFTVSIFPYISSSKNYSFFLSF